VSPQAADRFEQAYTRSLLPSAASKIAALRRTRGQAGATPGEAWALGGTVILPRRRLDKGWVTINGGAIAEVGETKPAHVRTLDTGGVIVPGLIDLHGHPNWNVFPAWEPPRLYANRAAWRESRQCRAVLENPMVEMTKDFSDKSFMALLARYAEIRALVGGTTAIQGATGGYPTAPQALVRHVALAPFGVANAASIVDPLKAQFADDVQGAKNGIDAGAITALYLHIAEGTDAASRAELSALASLGLLTSSTVVIHGTALVRADFGKMRDVGAKLVWSPHSNLRLYGQTTAAATARELGVPLALGADWLPSGSVGLLAEMQVARRVLAAQRSPIAASSLVEMVTVEAAEIAGLAQHLGQLAVGRPADLVVLERLADDPYESVCRAGRSSVELVAIGGHLLYGREEWFQALAPNAQLAGTHDPAATGELVWAWGKRMRLDVAAADDPTGHHPPIPGLKEIRSEILSRYTRAGPIFA
jgi:hypothetical protein